MTPRVAVWVGALLAASLAGCVTPRTELVVIVATDLEWGPEGAIDRVVATVRDDGPAGAVRGQREFTLGAAAGQHAMPLSFGVVPGDGGQRGTVWVEARGCLGPCADGERVVARAVATFVARETRALVLRLDGRCDAVRCDAAQTCGPATGTCVDARQTGLAPYAPGATPSPPPREPRVFAGLGQTCARARSGAVSCWGAGLPGSLRARGGDVDGAPREVPALRGSRDVALGRDHACAVRDDGAAVCWGRNAHGQLGDGSTSDRAQPAAVTTDDGAALTDVVEVGVGWEHSCARTRAGAVYCWGEGAEGALGNDRRDPRATARAVASLGGVAEQISVGPGRACAVLRSGDVLCWGRGAGARPARVSGVPRAVEVRVGWRHACARGRDGRVYCWGDNRDAQLGRADVAARDVAAAVPSLTDVTALSAGGGHTCALRSDGTARCWGRGDLGQLGDGSARASAVPEEPHGLGASVRAIAAGGDHTCAIAADDALQCWGGDRDGELGRGRFLWSTVARPVAHPEIAAVAAGPGAACGTRGGVFSCWGAMDPGWRAARAGGAAEEVPRDISGPRGVPGLPTPFVELALGARHSCARSSDGALWCWGRNDRGQIGEPGAFDRPTPTRALALAAARTVAAGRDHTCAATVSGAAWCWGANFSGQVGDGGSDDRDAPTATGVSGVVELAAGDAFTCARRDDGAVWCWGADAGGGRTPRAVEGVTDARSLAAGSRHACVARADGRVWCWGALASGRADAVTWTEVAAPRAVPGLDDVVEVRAGAEVDCARRRDGGVLCWGVDAHGALGDGTRAPRGEPVTVLDVTGATSVAVGVGHACAVVEGGAVRCWGDDASGQRGSATRESSLRPEPVVDASGAALVGAQRVMAGPGRTCAVGADWVRCWGANDDGQLGVGAWRSEVLASPARDAAGPLSDVTAIDAGDRHTCALRAGGRVACWGSNGDGRLGDGTRVDHPLATTVEAGEVTFQQVAAGGRHTCALDGGGAAWCWGDGRDGQLGDAVTARATPLRAPTTERFTSIGAGDAHTCGLSLAGEVWCWGGNARGELGRGDSIAHADVGRVLDDAGQPLRGASMLAVGSRHACALRPPRGVVCWGDDVRGQCGGDGGDVTRATTPRGWEITTGAVIALGAGSGVTCASLGRGNVATWCWGDNRRGQIVPSMPGDRMRPTLLAEQPFGASSLYYGIGEGFVCEVADIPGGAVWCYGANDFGERGVGTRAAVRSPIAVPGLAAVDGLTAGASHACATRAGAMFCWGRNDAGQLGDGTVEGSARAVDLAGARATRALGVGASHRCALIDDGSVRCWGSNRFGELGTVDAAPHDAPTAVAGLADAVSLGVGLHHTCAARRDGAVMCWGRSDALQTGSLPSSTEGPRAARGVLGAVQVGAGAEHACARLGDGRVMCWGDRALGQIGDGEDRGGPTLPVTVPGLYDVVELAVGARHACARQGNGAVWCWGDNAAGQIGDGTRRARLRPWQVRGDAGLTLRASEIDASRALRCGWTDDAVRECTVVGRDFTCARGVDGSVWCWGANDDGQLGDGTREDRPLPVRVRDVSGAREVVVGGRHACARTSAGWRCWGSDRDGEALDGVGPIATTPVAVVAP